MDTRMWWGFLMAGFSVVLCQDLNTEGGNPPIPTGVGAWEDWCNLDKWIPPFTFAGQLLTLENVCDRGLRIHTDGDMIDDEYQAQFRVDDSRTFNLQDRAIWFRMRPPQNPGTDWDGFVELRAINLNQNIFVSQYTGDGAALSTTAGVPAIYLEMTEVPSTTTSTVISPYQPNGNHAWWRLVYSVADTRLFVQFSQACGTWSTVFSQSLPLSHVRDLSLRFSWAVNLTGPYTGPLEEEGFLSPIYVDEFVPAMIADWTP